MLLVHKWVERYRDDPVRYAAAKRELEERVCINAGDAGAVLEAAREGAEPAWYPPPFPKVLIQMDDPFENHTVEKVLVFFSEEGDGRVVVRAAVKPKEKPWTAFDELYFTRNMFGGLDYAGDGPCNEFAEWYSGPDVGFRRGYFEEYVYFLKAANSVFAVMACSNVRTRDHQPDAALNKKRAKAGKVPLVSYKTLEIVVPNTRYEGGGSGGGTHASPRVHLRRGHIRKIADGKTVWVQACVVGSKHGMVLKDYKLRSAS